MSKGDCEGIYIIYIFVRQLEERLKRSLKKHFTGKPKRYLKEHEQGTIKGVCLRNLERNVKRSLEETHARVACFSPRSACALPILLLLILLQLPQQLMIALWNTFLTTLGLWLLGVSGAAFFTVLVFVCSFIPLLGVLLSTMPMGLAALGEYGVSKMIQVCSECRIWRLQNDTSVQSTWHLQNDALV